MAKNIVICLDGTWNKDDGKDPKVDGSEATNVNILSKIALDENDTQTVYYDAGVATHWYDHVIGGISGWGLTKNIIQAYAELVEKYQDGDNVFLFGFSRGAYTARSLAGFVYTCGLQESSTGEDEIEDLFRTYKQGSEEERRSVKASNRTCPIHMIGVWDTVGALGIPKIVFDEKLTDPYVRFHDTKLNPEIRAAYHAIACDEQRRAFAPTLWNVSAKQEGQILEQVWFAGVHADIGGGYPERDHSNIALRWMINCAEKHGLKLREYNESDFASDISQPIHDSYNIFYGARKPRRANILEYDTPVGKRKFIPKIHRSVEHKINVGNHDYWPLALVEMEDQDPDEDWYSLAAYDVVGRPQR